MKLSTYTVIITYLMAALGVSAIWLIEAMEPSFVVMTASFILLSLVFNVRKRQVLPGPLWNALAVAILVFFVVDYITISTSLIISSTRFATVLLVLKLFGLKRNRDYFIVFGLIFFQLLASAASTVSPLFIAILTLYIIGGIWAMIIFSIKSDYYAANGTLEIPGNIFGAPFFLSVIAVSAASLVMTFLLFFIIPRMGAGYFQRKTLDTVKVSGFSDTVELGSMGEVKKDPTVVMRVMPAANPPGRLYLRGAVLVHYDGKAWSGRLKDKRLLSSPNGVFRFNGAGNAAFEQKIQLEPLETEVLFGAPHITAVEGDFRNLWVDSSGAVRLPSPPFSRIEYKAWSEAAPVKDREGSSKAYIELGFLKDSPEGERIRELAQRITRGRTDPSAKAVAIELYLRGNFSYSLDPARDPKKGPIEDFLFNSKEGFCEHYATAMAVLLRSVGIPSRLVTGFVPEEWNSLGEYYIVRGQDSHSWVEAYIEGTGWKTFDPTPPAAGGPAFRPAMLSHYLDLLRWRWNRHIVYFSAADQRSIAGAFEGRASGLFSNLRKALKSKDRVKGPRGFIILAALFGLAGFAAWRLRRSVFNAKKSKIPGYYMEMLRLIEKKGLKKKHNETALEFAIRTGNPCVHTITGSYQAERYGGSRPTEAELFRVREALEALKRKGG